MFKFPDWCYGKLPSNYTFWFIAWLFWLLTLCLLSSGTQAVKHSPDIPHIDKVAHFGYFMLGSFFFANFLYLKKPNPRNWKAIIIATIITGSIVGAIDELHQNFTAGRTGCDPADWLADVLGTIAGLYYCYSMWQRLSEKTQ